MNLSSNMDDLPEELRDTRILPSVTNDVNLLATLGKAKQDILFSADFSFGDERDRFAALDQYGRHRVKEVGDLFQDPKQEDLELPVTIMMQMGTTKDRSIEPTERVYNASPASSTTYYYLGTIATDSDSTNASSSKNDEQPKFETECILLGYYHDEKKTEGFQLARVQAWRLNGVLVGDCDTSQGIKRLTKAMVLNKKYQEAELSKKELQKLVNVVIEDDDVDLREGVPILPFYTFNTNRQVASGKKKKARLGRQVHLLVRIVDFRGQEAECVGTAVLTLEENDYIDGVLEKFKRAPLEEAKKSAADTFPLELFGSEVVAEKATWALWVLPQGSSAKMYRFVDGVMGQFLGAGGEAEMYGEVHLLADGGGEASAEPKRKRRKV